VTKSAPGVVMALVSVLADTRLGFQAAFDEEEGPRLGETAGSNPGAGRHDAALNQMVLEHLMGK
jgi:hypothetical protein